MAIDTAAKRKSAAGVPFLPLGPGVTPDASKPVAWRQQAAWGYSGIVAAAPSVVTYPIIYFTVNFNTVQYAGLNFNTVQYAAPNFNTVQYSAENFAEA